ncbi:hypothetical protein SFRURICE_009796 [Spodoptera frugiperda]|nr:hypothetical protein SFRURICE_009796 [Spodoptera frugiperda]
MCMLRCCGCVWLPPIIFIGTHSLALVETDLAKFWFLNGKMRAIDDFPTIDTSHTRTHSYIAHLWWKSTLMHPNLVGPIDRSRPNV